MQASNSMVAQCESHRPHVLVTHHARSRPSAERKAAEYLGQVVHEVPGGQADSDP